MAVKFTDNNFKDEVLNSDIPVLVDFYADWCGPCKMMSPVIDELAKEYEGRVKIGKVDTDANRTVASEYKIMSIPTLVFVKDGKVVDTLVGVVPKATLEAKLDSLI